MRRASSKRAASALVASLYSAIGLMSVGMFAMYVTTSCYWAIVQDTVKGNNVGAVSGFIHFLANLSRRLMEQSVRNELLAATTREDVLQTILSHSDEGSI